jgi:Na+-driven multidrug efflux pump
MTAAVGLVDRARRVTLVSCVLAAAIFGTAGLGVAASGRWIVEQFTDAKQVVLAASGYFHVIGFVHSFMAVSVMLFSAYQGWGRATVPLSTSPLRVAVVLLGGWVILQWPDPELSWLYYLVAVSIMLSASTLAVSLPFDPRARPARCFPVEKAAGVGYGSTVFDAVPPWSSSRRAPGPYR